MSNRQQFEDEIFYKKPKSARQQAQQGEGGRDRVATRKNSSQTVMKTLDEVIRQLSESRQVLASGGRASRVQVEIDGTECVVDERVDYSRQPPIDPQNVHYHLQLRKTQTPSRTTSTASSSCPRMVYQCRPAPRPLPPPCNNNRKQLIESSSTPVRSTTDDITRATHAEWGIRDAIHQAQQARQRQEQTDQQQLKAPKAKPMKEFRSENRKIDRDEVLRQIEQLDLPSDSGHSRDCNRAQIQVHVHKKTNSGQPPQNHPQLPAHLLPPPQPRHVQQQQQKTAIPKPQQQECLRDSPHPLIAPKQPQKIIHCCQLQQQPQQRPRTTTRDGRVLIPSRPSRFEKRASEDQIKPVANSNEYPLDRSCYCTGIDEGDGCLPNWRKEIELANQREKDIDRTYDRQKIMEAWADHYGPEELSFPAEPLDEPSKNKNNYSNAAVAARIAGHESWRENIELSPQDELAAKNPFYGTIEVEANVMSAVKNLLKAQSCMRNVTFAAGTLFPPSGHYAVELGDMQKNLKAFNTHFRELAAQVKQTLAGDSVKVAPEKQHSTRIPQNVLPQSLLSKL